MLGMLIAEPAVLKTATASPDVLFQLLAFAGGVPVLWVLVQSVYRSMFQRSILYGQCGRAYLSQFAGSAVGMVG
jgi:hypothetical protein